jgi:hypothetical protein
MTEQTSSPLSEFQNTLCELAQESISYRPLKGPIFVHNAVTKQQNQRIDHIVEHWQEFFDQADDTTRKTALGSLGVLSSFNSYARQRAVPIFKKMVEEGHLDGRFYQSECHETPMPKSISVGKAVVINRHYD